MTVEETIALHVQLACVWEACAEKAGNVSRHHDFADTALPDFLTSAAAAAPVLARSDQLGVGPAILESVRRTRLVCPANTNLGIVLLLAPLCAAQKRGGARQHIGPVLAGLTVDDSRAVYSAIREAKPGGLGTVPEGDVADEPTRPLVELMALSAGRDRVAKQYATGFVEVLGEVATDIEEGFRRGEGIDAAIRHAQLLQLSAHGDSLIARKRGEQESREAARRATAVLAGGNWDELDGWLREGGNARNPGATADLIAAGLFVLLCEGRLSSRPGRW
jgi:triphosphoribosyl-dephospho-CoA synthase